MSMKTRSQSTTSAKSRVDYKKLANDHEEDDLPDPRPTSKARRDPPSPSAPADAPLIASIPPPPAAAATAAVPPPPHPPPPPPPPPSQHEQATVAHDDKEAEKPAVGQVTDTSKIIDEFLKALRPDAEEPARSNPAARGTQPGAQDGTSSVNQSPTVPNHAYDILPPPRQRPETISVQKDTKFPCTFARYGCTSTFGSKNEWKRHVAIQHVQLGFYRCDVGVCNPDNRDPHSRDSGYNDFNRKDLFTMHQRRMHSPWGVTRQPTPEEKEAFETSLENVRQRCWRAKRQPPLRTTCGFCGRVFEDKVPLLPGAPAVGLPGSVLTIGQDASAMTTQPPQLQQESTPSRPDDKADPMEVDRKAAEPGNPAQAQSSAPAQPSSYGQNVNGNPASHASQPVSVYPPLNTPSTPGTLPSAYPPVPSPGTTSSYPPLPGYSQNPDSVQRPLAPGPPPPQQIQVDAHGQPIVKDPTAWEDRMEHVGRHLAKEDAHLRDEAEDADLTAWGLREGLLRDCGPKGVWLIGHEPQGDSLDGIIRKRKKRIK